MTATTEMSPAELLAVLRDETKQLLEQVKAERAANDKALAEMKAQVSKLATRQNEYDAKLEEQTKKALGAINALGRKVVESTQQIDLEAQAEKVAGRMDAAYAKGEAMAERHEKILNNIGLVVGYVGQWMLFAAVLVWGVGFLVWSLVRGWSMLVAESSGAWDKVLGFSGWAVFTCAVVAGLFFGGRWLYGRWRA